jgi:hypothetical protein
LQLPETLAPGTSTGVSSGPIQLVEELQASTGRDRDSRKRRVGMGVVVRRRILAIL